MKKWRFEGLEGEKRRCLVAGLDDKAEDWLDKNKAKQRKHLPGDSMLFRAPTARYKTGEFPDPYPLPPPEETPFDWIRNSVFFQLHLIDRCRSCGLRWTCWSPR